MRITSQEVTLSGKSAFENWDTTFGVKIHRYNADNGRFSEQPLRSATEDANQKITFCGAGSHHKNTIDEKNSTSSTRR